MRHLELWATLIALSASAALAGCGRARGCIEGCGAAQDAGSEAEAGLPLPPACPAQRICPHIVDIHDELAVYLGAENRGTVYLGNAVYTPVGPAVSWVSMPLHAGDPRHAGVALLLQNKVAGFVENVPADAYPEAPPLFQRDNELDLVVPSTSYDHVIRVPMDTFVPSTPVLVPISGMEHDPPAVLGIGQTLAAITKPSHHLVFVDSTLSQRLIDKPIHSGDLLTATCNGFLAVNSGIGQAQPFDNMGNAVGPVVSWKGGSGEKPVWDGASVTLCEGKQIVELASNGSVQSITPTPPDADRGAIVAVGTDDGVLATMVVGGPSVLRVLERGTGAVIDELNYPGHVAVAGDHGVYFAQSSGYAGTSILWAWVQCGD